MGALTSLTKWIPEDDLLLKNAIEAGASLESLAKGAVQFSRRFTIRELKDRWHSLLYDLDTSIEASARIVDIENDLNASNIPKAMRALNPDLKEKDLPSGKRKRDSVRSLYNSMRKRIRSEPSAANLSFLLPSTLLAGIECDGTPTDQSNPQNKNPAYDSALDVALVNASGHPETGYFSGQHPFPEPMKVDSAATNDFHQLYHTRQVGSVKDEIPDGLAGEGYLFGLAESIFSAPCDEAKCNTGNQSLGGNFQQRDFPHILGDDPFSVDASSSDVHVVSQSNDMGCPCKNDVGAKPLPVSDSSNNNDKGLRSDFVENIDLHSRVFGSNSFFDQFNYTSPTSGRHICGTTENTSSPAMPIHGHCRNKGHEFPSMSDNKNICAPIDIVSSEHKLAGSNNPTIMQEKEFMEFSDNYMDFTDHRSLLLADVDEGDNMGRSFHDLNSILLSSPDHTHLIDANSNDLGATNPFESSLEILGVALSGKPDVPCDRMQAGLHSDHATNGSDAALLSSFAETSTTRPRQEFVICVLNTEDQDIPDNDYVLFPGQECPPFSSNLEQCARRSTSANVLSINGRDCAGDSNKVKESKAILETTVSSLKTSLAKGVLHSCGGCLVETGSSKCGCIAPNNAVNGVGEPKLCYSEKVLNSVPVASVKEESTALCFQNLDDPDACFASFLENHLQETDDPPLNETNNNAPVNETNNNVPLNETNKYPENSNMRIAHQTCLLPCTDLASVEVGFDNTNAIMSTSGQKEQSSDNENDVPYFSDVEAMILDMDLDPYIEESCLLSKEVSRYQQMDTKNVMRWEQGFRSHINRSISSHGAFAVFYGRHLKYFIKDPEVTIGRETRDAKVDIDLGREGRANKISRLQAIIKMDEEGLFSLLNIGKFSVFVNGKEVPAKKRINLPTNSLIKIQDMCFAFEVNESAVRRYLKRQRDEAAMN